MDQEIRDLLVLVIGKLEILEKKIADLGDQQDWVRVDDAAKEMNLDRRTVLKYIKQGELGHHYRFNGTRTYLVNLPALRKMLSGINN